MGKQKHNVQRPTLEEKQTWLETDPISRTPLVSNARITPRGVNVALQTFYSPLSVNCGSALLQVIICPRSNIQAFYSLKLLFKSSMRLIERIVNNSSRFFLSSVFKQGTVLS